MSLRTFVLIVLMSVGLAPLASPSDGFGSDAPRITKEEAKALLGSPDVLFLDARTAGAWSGSGMKIKGALRADPSDVDSWAGTIPKDKKIIIYCT